MLPLQPVTAANAVTKAPMLSAHTQSRSDRIPAISPCTNHPCQMRLCNLCRMAVTCRRRPKLHADFSPPVATANPFLLHFGIIFATHPWTRSWKGAQCPAPIGAGKCNRPDPLPRHRTYPSYEPLRGSVQPLTKNHNSRLNRHSRPIRPRLSDPARPATALTRIRSPDLRGSPLRARATARCDCGAGVYGNGGSFTRPRGKRGRLGVFSFQFLGLGTWGLGPVV